MSSYRYVQWQPIVFACIVALIALLLAGCVGDEYGMFYDDEIVPLEPDTSSLDSLETAVPADLSQCPSQYVRSFIEGRDEGAKAVGNQLPQSAPTTAGATTALVTGSEPRPPIKSMCAATCHEAP